MSASFYVYVGKASRVNYATGRTHGVWGWQTSVLDRRSGDGTTNRGVASRIRSGDYLILGFGAPGGPRVDPHSFLAQNLTEVLVTEVTCSLYTSDSVVWDDKPYPERVDLKVLESLEDVPGLRLGRAAMEALRLSGTKQGAPVPGGSMAITAFQEEATHGQSAEIGLADDLDALATAKRRREQRLLRRLKFGTQTEATCDLCGRRLPIRLVSAAHIKRRSEATNSERRNLSNIMAACLLGCDALFEHGHIYVDNTGAIRISQDVRGELLSATHHLSGRQCAAYGPLSRPFFEAHARRLPPDRLDIRWLPAAPK